MTDDTSAARPQKKRFDMDAWWQDRTTPQKVFWGIGFGILGVGFVAGLGLAVMALWNWLLPDLFGFKRIGYWQAAGLFVLCWILFKGFKLPSESSSRSTDRRRREHLKSYLQDGSSAAEGTEGGA